jgi:hypothetical protein
MEFEFEAVTSLFNRVEQKRGIIRSKLVQNFGYLVEKFENESLEASFYSLHSKIINRIRSLQLRIIDRNLNHTLVENNLSNFKLLGYELNDFNKKNQKENLFSKFNVIGSVKYNNDFSMHKKLKYMDFYANVRQMSTLNFKEKELENELKIQNTILIDFDSIFYHFKSKDHRIDLLMITNQKSFIRRKCSIKFDSICFTKYLLNTEFIVGQESDFSTKLHCLKMYNMKLECMRMIKFDDLISLILVNRNEIIFFKPFEYSVLDLATFQLIRRFGQYESTKKPFCLHQLNKLCDASITKFSFLSSTSQELKILEREKGDLIQKIDLEINDEFKIGENFVIKKNHFNNIIYYFDLQTPEKCLKNHFNANFNFILSNLVKANENYLYSIDEIAQFIRVF